MTDRQILEQILGKVGNLETRIGNVEQGQKNLEQGQKNLEQGQKSLEQGQAETNKRLETVEHGQGALSVALQNLGANLKEQLVDLRETLARLISDGYDLHNERITALEEEVGIKPRKH